MIIRELSGVIELAEPMTLTEPTTLRGPAVLRGSCRDALVYARAEVVLEGVHVERTPRPDGTPSWGSCVVVEGAAVATLRGCRKALDVIEDAVADGSLPMPEREVEWIGRMRDEIATIPDDESKFIAEMLPTLDSAKFIASEYGL